jgi:hypothetical protein
MYEIVFKKNLHNIETDFYGRVSQQAQIIKRCPGQAPPPLGINC